MHWGKIVDVLPYVICLKVFCPTFKILVEIQLHISCKQVEMSYILGGGNVYMGHDRMCYLRPYICCKIIVD
jgi:hypothetical protein